MPAFIQVADHTLNKAFVAYNLVFGPPANGLPTITASRLSDAMSDKGYDMPVKEAEAYLRRWYDQGGLRLRMGDDGKRTYVIA